jgi:endonuclease YncB( thermonuclease family)
MAAQSTPQSRRLIRRFLIVDGRLFMKFLIALFALLLPAVAEAADITGVPKIREADHIQIGNARIRLGGIDGPQADQLCLNPKGERWGCGAAARDELIKYAGNKIWNCNRRQVTDRRGRTVARCDVDGEDIQKWLVRNGWALALVRITRDYEPDEKAAREAKAGMWQGARDSAGLGVGTGGALAGLHHQGQRQPFRRMHLSSAHQPLVCENPHGCGQGHPLVLFGRRGRSRRLPGDAAIARETRRVLLLSAVLAYALSA